MALAAKRDGRAYRVFCLLSDGECDEGSTWEPILFAPQHRLDNLIAIVDYNKIQSLGTVKEVMDLDPFADKWRAFGWAVREMDGHDLAQVEAALGSIPFESGKPTCVIAHTVKGKGVSLWRINCCGIIARPRALNMRPHWPSWGRVHENGVYRNLIGNGARGIHVSCWLQAT